MPKIKILFTIPNFKTAGSQYVLLAIFNRLDREVFDPYVCVEKFPELIPAEIPLHRRMEFSFGKNKTKGVTDFRKLLKTHRIDIVHSWDYKSNFWEPLSCRMAGVKYLYTKKNNAWSKRWWLKSVLAHHIAYDNPQMKERFFDSLIFRKKTTFVPHGVNSEVFRPFPKDGSQTFNIGCIGNMGSNKNQLFIIKALKKLPANVVLHLYGHEDEVYKAHIMDYIQSHGLNDRVRFHGFIENIEIPRALKNIDVFVLASVQEGLPVSLLEAMACGIPVLSSDSGGGARFLLAGEYIYSLDSQAEFVAKFLDIYHWSPEQRENMGKQLRDQVLANHTVEMEVAKYENLYKKIR